MGTPLVLGARSWPGAWVAAELDLKLVTTASAVGVSLADLVGLAVRRNPRRAHLLVSTVLGKHVPTDPHLVYGSGRLLGLLVADVLAGRVGLSGEPSDRAGGQQLRAALAGSPDAARRLLEHCDRHRSVVARERAGVPTGTVVLGYAETATALGHAVADSLDVACLHSTRRPVPGVAPVGGFEEEHSHATSHLLLPENPAFLAGGGALVLVDDELSTGTTVLNTIAALHSEHPRNRYVVASLVDLRSTADRSRMTERAAELGVRIDVVSLAEGSVQMPDDILARGAHLVSQTEQDQTGQDQTGQDRTGQDRTGQDRTGQAESARRVEVEWPAGLRDGGRHGFASEDRVLLEQALSGVAAQLRAQLTDTGPVHVLGFEELMYTPLRLAESLAEQLPERPVTYSTTTRSPVLAVDADGYAIRTRLQFDAHDNPDDGPGLRFAYNVAAPLGSDRFSTVVVVIDSAADTPELHGDGGLLQVLSWVTSQVLLVVVPGYRPTDAVPTFPSTTFGDLR